MVEQKKVMLFMDEAIFSGRTVNQRLWARKKNSLVDWHIKFVQFRAQALIACSDV